MKQKLAVFPYDSELSCLWKYSDLLQEYEIGCLIVPRGWGLQILLERYAHSEIGGTFILI